MVPIGCVTFNPMDDAFGRQQTLIWIVAMSLLCWPLAACQTAAGGTITIAAAASLTAAFENLSATYEASSGERLVLSFASSGALAEQLRNGGPFDIFAAADADHVDQLIEEGILAAATRTVFAHGQLVLLLNADLDADLTDITELLNPDIERIAIANPEFAPYGLAAEQLLKNLGLWEQVKGKLIMAETVRQAAVFVQTGNADAGIVARSVVVPGEDTFFPLPSSAYPPILHVAAVRADSPHMAEAVRFLEYLTSPAGREILEGYGFSNAEDDQP
jgi:molybdate transport system substrate-binding protein